jgi:hypothetical protein
VVVTLQVQLDPETMLEFDKNFKITFTEEELHQIQAEMNEMCHRLEKLSYIRYQMYVDGKVWNPK